MSEKNSLTAGDLALPFACILVVSTLFAAGLWPFNPFPRNQVAWLNTGKGLQFGDHGVVFSKESIESNRLKGDSFCTLAIRLQPDAGYPNGSGNLLGFYTPEDPSQFRLMQWRDVLLIRKDYRDAEKGLKTAEIDLEQAFLAGEPVSFTITANPDGSVAYQNGVRAASTTRTGLSCGDFAGQLVLGDSAVIDNPWRGKVLDVVIYDRELTSKEIASEYASWNANQTIQELGGDQHVVAHYAFNEGSGRKVHGQAGAAPDLYIPEIFKVPHKKMLMWPWEESHDKRDFRDISINILGFVPFGFVFVAYLTLNRNVGHPAIMTVFCGAAISLAIEILQVYIPGRDSGILDVITNTFGTFLGALLFRWIPMQNLTRKLLDALRSGDWSLQN
jgi:VanZ like protein/concanavalin A-like lectin/glucanase superfamily protein